MPNRDRVVIAQLPDHDYCVHETAAGDQVAVVVSFGVQAQQLIEALGERFGNGWQLDQ